MPAYTIALSDLTRNSLDLAGGKGANLGELLQARMNVPDGFCITTRAFARFIETSAELDKFYTRLEQVEADDWHAAGEVGADLRSHLQGLSMPDDVRRAVVEAWRAQGADGRYAVRSSATAEDLPGASFAGQHDSILNVSGEDELVDAVQRCWISLFTDRAIVYRIRHGFDHRAVALAVVVQSMVEPEVAGVLFTADPISGHRRSIVINAAYGLGEAVVAGLVNPDLYRVDHTGTLHQTIADKRVAVMPAPGGGTVERPVPAADRTRPALTEQVVHELAALGRRIQDHFGAPQDVEWAWSGERLVILQSRPITSLFPTPPSPADERLHVYFSFGHQQMMTDAIAPLGLSVLRNFFPFGRRGPDGESTQMVAAANRLFFDYTDPLHTRLGRRLLARAAGSMDPRVGHALRQLAERADFRAHHRVQLKRTARIHGVIARSVAQVVADLCWADMSVRRERTEAFVTRTLANTRATLDGLSGAERIAAIQRDLHTVPLQIFFRIPVMQLTALAARQLIESLTERWIGPTDELPSLYKALPGNVTTEMGLAVGDLADLVRDHPDLLALLSSRQEPFTMDVFDTVAGGPAFREAFEAFLARYGMRGPGEIDITRTRWSERPSELFSGIVANTGSSSAGEHRRRFEAGVREAEAAAGAILGRIRATRLGTPKAATMARVILVYRTVMGLREHQKYLTVSLLDLYRRGIREEAAALAAAGVLSEPGDVDFLTLHELRQLCAGQVLDQIAVTIAARRAEHARHAGLKPPRLYTSDGELVTATAGPARDGVLTGCAVSAGVVEGRARIVLRPQDAELRDGDILIAPSTDPGWTPLFSAVRGMVIEIGGMMSHGAVVARELGLPAVVGVDDATRRIRDGARIRVDGSQGLVEILPE